MSNIKIFEEKSIRSHWNSEQEEWYFSVVDVCGVLSGSVQPRKYWSDLKVKLDAEGSELSEKIGQLKMLAEDGKMRTTDVLDTKGVLRLVQSIPSKKAEPFKLWLAEVGAERLDEIADPEKALQRGFDYYRQKGYTEGWINQRLQTIEMRKKLTDEWKERGIDQNKDYAILTDEMTKAWSGKTIKGYKEFKGITKQNLRDNMTDIELTLNQLAEVSTTAISKKERPETINENRQVARRGGSVAKAARKSIEKELGTSAVSSLNASDKPALEIRKDKEEDEE